MKIRSITCFAELSQSQNAPLIQQLAEAAQAARQALQEVGYEVQSTRLASQPFSNLIEGLDNNQVSALAHSIEADTLSAGFGYLSLGPVLAGQIEQLKLIAPILSQTQASFLSMQLVAKDGFFDPAFFIACAKVIRQVATLEPNGFANLKLAALANVAPGSPFFPAAYHAGGQPAFAFAPQAADLAVQAFLGAESIAEASLALTKTIENHSQKLETIGAEIEKQHGIEFLGIDFSMAPYPSDKESLGKAIEEMGVPQVGLQGSLTAAAILTSAIQQAQFKRTGFNGLLMPPLEDAVLAQRTAQGVLGIQDLLLYSAVCGTGIDTLALPGDASEAALAAILMDLAALATRLDKPLTARLLPIPGKKPGDETDFDFEFFANSRVIALEGQGLQPPLSNSPPFKLLQR